MENLYNNTCRHILKTGEQCSLYVYPAAYCKEHRPDQPCKHIFMFGKRKGTFCTKLTYDKYCSRHKDIKYRDLCRHIKLTGKNKGKKCLNLCSYRRCTQHSKELSNGKIQCVHKYEKGFRKGFRCQVKPTQNGICSRHIKNYMCMVLRCSAILNKGDRKVRCKNIKTKNDIYCNQHNSWWVKQLYK